MLKRHFQFLQSVLFLFDLATICGCWLLVYYLQFLEGLAPVDKGIPPFEIYLWFLVPILVIWGTSFRAFNLYRPRRMGSHLAEFLDIARANTISVLVLVAFTAFYRQFEYSRLVFLYFWFLNLLALGFSRMAFKVHGFLTRHPNNLGKNYEGIEVIGLYSDIERYAPGLDIVFLCLPPDEEQGSEKMFQFLATTTIEVKVIPSIYEFITLRAEAEMFEGLPVITLQGSPLNGWNMILKRITDLVGASIALALTGPIMLMMAFVVKITSTGPVFYRQERMGLDGKPFMMLKFRSMRIDQAGDTVILTPERDPRVTTVGRFLRNTSLDELPQFWNVLKGEMSIVGPRPERSWLVDEVRKQIPLYMLKHKMKAGNTGWAQAMDGEALRRSKSGLSTISIMLSTGRSGSI